MECTCIWRSYVIIGEHGECCETLGNLDEQCEHILHANILPHFMYLHCLYKMAIYIEIVYLSLKNLNSTTFETKVSYYALHNIWKLWYFLVWPNVSLKGKKWNFIVNINDIFEWDKVNAYCWLQSPRPTCIWGGGSSNHFRSQSNLDCHWSYLNHNVQIVSFIVIAPTPLHLC